MCVCVEQMHELKRSRSITQSSFKNKQVCLQGDGEERGA